MRTRYKIYYWNGVIKCNDAIALVEKSGKIYFEKGELKIESGIKGALISNSFADLINRSKNKCLYSSHYIFFNNSFAIYTGKIKNHLV